MPRYRDGFPRPAKEYHHGVWRVIWRWEGKKYSVATAIADKEAHSEIEAYVRNLASQLATKERPTVSAPWSEMPGVMRYIDDRFGIDPSPEHRAAPSPEKWLADYAPEIKSECAAPWAKYSISRLRALDNKIGLALLTPKDASALLSDIANRHKIGTRNRYLSIFSRFYNWAVRTERTTSNPFDGIKSIKEEKSLHIVYCTPKERDELIAIAEATGREDWLAIPLAFYGGMRREEIANLEWQDVRFAEGILVVGRTKTKKSRIAPLNSKLESLLRPLSSGRTGHVVKISGGVDRLLRLDNLVRTIRKVKNREMLDTWNIQRPMPSRSKEYVAQKKEFEAAMKARAEELKTALNRIGWNSFRHTFGSLLAQGGVSIDKISSWMGNTPEVCRRHYAQFVPRDRRDDEIDKL